MFFVLRTLWRLYQRHLDVWMLPFQSIFESRNELNNVERNKYFCHYRFRFSIIAMIIIDTCIQYYNDAIDVDNTKIFHHIIMSFHPTIFKMQVNIIFSSMFAVILFVNGYMWLERSFCHVEYILLCQDEGSKTRLTMPYRAGILSVVPDDLGKKLTKFYWPAKKKLKTYVSF